MDLQEQQNYRNKSRHNYRSKKVEIMVCNEGAREVHVTASALTGLRIEKYGLRYRDIEELLRLEERGMLREWLLHKLTRMGPEGVQEIKND